ncbi:MAG: LD-carboxypeptidase [Acidobacteriota bacterium]
MTGKPNPPPLGIGDTIGVAAPAGPPEPAALKRGIRWLEARGFRVEVAPSVGFTRGYLAGSDRQRLDDLNHFLSRPDIKAIWFARGGYGSGRILDGVDFAAARRFPKRWLGYSDITALQLGLYRRTRLVSFYGPMVVELGPRTRKYHSPSLESALRGGEYPELRLPPGKVWRTGRGNGPLIGGCLSLICSLLGTPFEPDLRGKVLFWEEVGEEPFRIDRYLTQLRLAGAFQSLQGMLIGRLVGCRSRMGRRTLSLREILKDVLAGTRFPVACDLPFGHGPGSWTLPVGYRAGMDTGRGRVRFSEP